MFDKILSYCRKMAREINLVCDFFFSFMCTNLPMHMVDMELTIRTVQGIYIHHKDHTAESTIFTPWSKSVTPFLSLRKKIKAFKEESREQLTLTWMPSVSTPTKPPRNPRRHTQARPEHDSPIVTIILNLIKMNWVNTLGTDLTDANKINIIRPIPQKAYEHFGATCLFCS